MPPIPDPHALAVLALTATALFLFTRERIPLETSSLVVLVVLTVGFEWFPYQDAGGPLHTVDFFSGFVGLVLGRRRQEHLALDVAGLEGIKQRRRVQTGKCDYSGSASPRAPPSPLSVVFCPGRDILRPAALRVLPGVGSERSGAPSALLAPGMLPP